MKNDAFRRCLNFRELGGYTVNDGRTIPHNIFFRSGALNLLNKEELAEFDKLSIRFILDLRTKEEVSENPDPFFEDVEYLRYSGVLSQKGEDIDFSPNGMRQIGSKGKDQLSKLTEYYKQMPFNNEAIRVLIQNVSSYNTPLLFHCASGKDRTGIAAMLILLLLGADEQTVIEDYILSNVYLKEDIEKEMVLYQNLIKKDPSLQKLLLMLRGVNRDIIIETMNSIKERYVTYDDYFVSEHSLSKTDLIRIRNHYLL